MPARPPPNSLPRLSSKVNHPPAFQDGAFTQDADPPAAQSVKSETRPSSSHYNSRAALPPTPPMSSDASFEGHHSPSAKSVSQMSVVSAPSYYYESTPPLESDLQRQHMATRAPVQASPYPPQAYQPSQYMAQPPMATYYPAPAPPQVSGLYYQRPLPQVSNTCPPPPRC